MPDAAGLASPPIAFIDLKAQRDRIRERIDAAMTCVVDHGAFISGPEVREFEDQLAGFCGARHAVSCANGTDALVLALMALDIGPGDAVFVPSFTFAATGEAPAVLGATPVFVDVYGDSFNMNPESLAVAIDMVKKEGALRPAAVIPVDLFGQPADYAALGRIARAEGLRVIADAAQSFGATLDGANVGTLAEITTTSFFPAKPLGCYGDGGAVLTDENGVADALRSFAVHGKGTEKYDNVRIGMNSRLDTLQAAILIEKLAIFADEIERRAAIARRYTEALADVASTPVLLAGVTSAWAQYTLVVDNRDQLAARLKEEGVPTAIYYPKPLHRQTAYRECPVAPGGLPVSDELSGRVLSLPMHPYLDATTQDRIVEAVVGGQEQAA